MVSTLTEEYIRFVRVETQGGDVTMVTSQCSIHHQLFGVDQLNTLVLSCKQNNIYVYNNTFTYMCRVTHSHICVE